MNQSQKNYALPIAMMFMLYFMIAFVTNLQTPFANVVKDQFQLANWQSLLGNLANFIAYAVMGIPAGLLLQKNGYKTTALTAVAVGFVGVSITLGSGFIGSFAVYLTGAFISGFSMCLLNTVVNPMLNSLGADEKKGNQLNMFGGVFNSTGGTIAPIFAGILVGQVANATISDVSPALYVGMAIFALTFVVLYFVQIPELHIAKAVAKVKETHSALSFRHFKFGIAAIFVYVGVEVGIQAIAYLYMTASATPASGPAGFGFDAGVAGTIVGTYWLLMLVGRFLGGLIAGKVSSKVMLSVVTLIGTVLVLVAMFAPPTMVKFPAINSSLSVSFQDVPLNVVFLILCGLCTSVMWPSIFNLATSGLGKYTAMASGVFMVMVCGGGILPALQGFIADNIGYMASYWVIVIGLLYMFFFAVAGSKNVNKDIDVEVKK
jgi:FHS family L-fucose permease-like MFS transporter